MAAARCRHTSAAQAYLPKLILKNVTTKPAQPGGVGMFGQVTNSGARALDQVELTVSYYGNDGKPTHAERHTPIATPLQFTDFNLPIVPFGPGETRDFGVTLKAPPEIAQEGQPRAAVTGIIFSQAQRAAGGSAQTRRRPP